MTVFQHEWYLLKNLMTIQGICNAAESMIPTAIHIAYFSIPAQISNFWL